MPRSDRAPSFQFYPGDYLLDDALGAMSYEQQGRYWRAICHSWQKDSPGRATEDQWRRWCGYSEAEWPANRDAIASAFKVRADGLWIQKRTVEVRDAQRRRQAQARKGASVTNERRKGSHAQRTHSDPRAVAPSSSSSSSGTQEQEQKHRGGDQHAPNGAPTDPTPAGTGAGADGLLRWEDLTPKQQRERWFHFGMPPPTPTEQEIQAFAEAYPKPTTAKMVAKALGNAVRRHAKDPSPDDAQDLIAKARAYAREVEGMDPDERRFVPNATRWLDEDSFKLVEFDDEDCDARSAGARRGSKD